MEEFKFPDEMDVVQTNDTEDKLEVVVEADDVEVEIVDDTPEQDRGRKPMKDAPAEVTDDELENYSESVKKRIQHFSKGYHEERRAKEAALREREEALRLAQNLFEENKKLQGSVGQNQQALLEQAKKVIAAELDDAKRKLKEAKEAFDTDAETEAAAALMAVQIKAERLQNFRPPALQKPETPVQNVPPAQPVQPEVQVDTKARAWQDANPWFGSNKEMTGFALAVHDTLVGEGVDPTSDEYYERINGRVRQVFPDAFPTAKTRKSVVAPASRSVAPKKITLTHSQVNIAKRLGLTNEQYARAVAEQLRKQNG